MPDKHKFDDDSIRPPAELEPLWFEQPEIVKLGDPVLRRVAKPVGHANQETHALIQRMTEIMRKANGLGLAAPQVGVSNRILIYDAEACQAGEGLRVLINPTILSMHGEQTDPPEGCLSIPGLQGVVPRAKEIRVKGFDARLRPISIRAKDLEARVIQHEVDHLNGVLFIDRADPETLVWLVDQDESDEPALRE